MRISNVSRGHRLQDRSRHRRSKCPGVPPRAQPSAHARAGSQVSRASAQEALTADVAFAAAAVSALGAFVVASLIFLQPRVAVDPANAWAAPAEPALAAIDLADRDDARSVFRRTARRQRILKHDRLRRPSASQGAGGGSQPEHYDNDERQGACGRNGVGRDRCMARHGSFPPRSQPLCRQERQETPFMPREASPKRRRNAVR